MLCQNCQQREAVVHLTKIINGQAAQLHLCQECAQKAPGTGFNLYPGMVSDFLQALFGVNPAGQYDQTIVDSQPGKCPGCGRTFSQIQQAGKMGCSKCYDEFEPQMEMLLRRIHGRGMHVGKVPVRRGASFRNKQEIVKSKEQLLELVKAEKFEEAAILRDRIKEMENTVGGESK
ncbi:MULTISPECIES: UvrB/UvrC motif-containing protein [Dehalobacter]|jgi:protein arginine kinase activator|uniref:DNA helicase UvrBC n=2 Tax=Dehalobacter restrictus TaxID=55583 RepID=A0A857DFX6_9FIRM|nr:MULTISPECIES: UvrB/UvrC motif-containing protein [Dehalobacter]AHF09070.1 UvrB/UvrC protein [Dehalobacter restrictus DSM 9455]MDJ0306808.1 UvrB/UvrC motif-containing protein [Dehalobacter sp.]OCZ53686.1 DNA helicase UvrBC [Dehalobacter sp. TeCB1]QGZ99610.1 DNA helicase UvrBC [Dehalobacter restrictus]